MRKLHAMLTLAAGCLLVASCGRGGSGENEARKFVVLDGKLPAGKNVLCAIDQVNSKRVKSKPITVESGHPVHIRGWMSGPNRQAPGEFDVLLVGETTYAAPGAAGIKRTDVARALKSEALANSGFGAAFDLSNVEGGTYQVKALQTLEGQSFYCNSRAEILVVDSPQ